jgi:hypothetical protein
MYLLLVKHSTHVETLDYDDLNALIREAADYEKGEYSGRIVGAVEMIFHKSGDLHSTQTRPDLWDDIWTELRSDPVWRKTQASLERYGARSDADD